MEFLNFINKNKNLSYEDIKDLLEKDYNLKIRLDKYDNYYMVSTTNESNFKDNLVRQCTGIILEKKTNKIIHYFGEKAYDIVNNYYNNIIELEKIDINKCLIAPYRDGYIIKIFNYKQKWNFATSRHTNIKYFIINNKTNTTLYDIFKETILKTFNSINDFLNTLDENYCYSFILSDNIYMINKVFLDTLEEYFNFNNFKPFRLSNINYNIEKYILIEKDINGKINNKIHVSKNDIKDIIHKNKYCIFNKECFNKNCKYKHFIKPNIEENYKKHIFLEKKKNPLFKSQNCKNGNVCKKHEQNKCIFRHEDDPI